MKKLLLLIPIFALVFTSCSKDNDNITNPKQLDLSGIWYVSSSTPFDITSENADSIVKYSDEKPMPYDRRYEFRKVNDGLYEYRVYHLTYPQPKDMCDNEYMEFIQKIIDGEVPITVCHWFTTKEWNNALITENQMIMNLYTNAQIKMEMLKLDNNTISFVNHDVYLGEEENAMKVDAYTTLKRSSNRVLPIEKNTVMY